MTPAGPVPRATYRLQLTRNFGFRAAGALAGYLGRLGISHAYLSPILKARPGSTHGYDVVDPAQINPELGTEADFREMAGRFRAEGIGIILDIVPNHMGIGGSDNPYWLDILENGAASRFASWFDIDWKPPEPSLEGKILVPFLDRPLDRALADGLLELRRSEDGKAAIWVYGHHKLPLAAESLDMLADGPVGTDMIARLLPLQHWRLAAADTGDDEINYRRFFTISDLAGIRIEDEAVFSLVHRLPFQWIAEGLVDGLRIDHIDGLREPTAYLRKLRARAPRPIHVVVEKILAESEALPAAWPVDGTTGYEFAALVTPFLTDPQAERPLDGFYRQFTGVTEAPGEIERASKLRVMDHELAAELNSLAFRLKALADAARPGHDLTRYALRRTLRSVVASLGIYRTYFDAGGLSEADATRLRTAFADARRRDPDLARRAFDFVESIMTGGLAGEAAYDLALRIQQFTGPVMAKGLEDTALYRANRLISLNDVGERPDRFSVTIEAFHAAVADRLRTQPQGLLGSSTHDSKRGEDARHRIGAISGHAAEWIVAVPQWVELIEARGAPAIARDDAYVFFQLLVGAWPGPDLTERLSGAMQKSLREARLRSSWAAPDAAHEAKVDAFLRLALEPNADNAFLDSFRDFAARPCHDGAVNGLIATVLKLTVPGVPDIYQGAERWNLMLVDPDNRRPIDFAAAQTQEAAGRPFDSLLGDWEDGAVKQALIQKLLGLRRARPALFARGDYIPITVPDSARLLAFERRHGEDRLFVAIRRFPWRGEAGEMAAPAGSWHDAVGGGRIEAEALRFEAALPFRVLTNFRAG